MLRIHEAVQGGQHQGVQGLRVGGCLAAEVGAHPGVPELLDVPGDRGGRGVGRLVVELDRDLVGQPYLR